jgi:hypothetical protein
MTPSAVNRYGWPVTFDRPWRVISVASSRLPGTLEGPPGARAPGAG